MQLCSRELTQSAIGLELYGFLTARETEVNCDSESVRNSSSKNYTLKHLLDNDIR